MAPPLRFTPTSWAKLCFLRDAGPTEIGGFGLSRPGDLLLVEDILLVKQRSDSMSVAFDDEAVADLFDHQIEQGRQPQEFGRIWIHTHPAISARPSGIDEETFARVFGQCDWAVMFILARGGASYARLQLNAGPGGQYRLPVQVDYGVDFGASDHDAWQQEFEASVLPVTEAFASQREVWSSYEDWRWRLADDELTPQELADVESCR